jgi:hypothetical protein
VRQVAEAHGGKISAETAPGGGTLMRLQLPALPTASTEGAVDHAPMPAPALSGDRRPA